MRPSQRRRLRAGAVAAAVVVAGAVTLAATTHGGSSSYDGDALALARPTTTLTDTSGKPFDFGARDGKATLVYFGYTHCPDVCPTTMADVHQALEHVPASVREGVQVVFVTVDPQHDTPPVMRAWLDDFDPSYTGLTGSYSDILAVGNALDAGVAATPPKTVDGKVDVEHGSTLVGITPSGGAPVSWIPSVDGSSSGPDLQQQLEHDLPLLEQGKGA